MPENSRHFSSYDDDDDDKKGDAHQLRNPRQQQGDNTPDASHQDFLPTTDFNRECSSIPPYWSTQTEVAETKAMYEVDRHQDQKPKGPKEIILTMMLNLDFSLDMTWAEKALDC